MAKGRKRGVEDDTASPADIEQILRERLVVGPKIAGLGLGIGEGAVREAVKRGEIPTTGVGRIVRIPTSFIRKRLCLEQAA